jgi:hypothetical protein
MVGKFSLFVGLVFLASLTAQAQAVSDKVELFGGYSYLRTDSPPGNVNGWELSGQYKVAPFFGGVADFDGHYGTVDGFSTSIHTFLFGPPGLLPGGRFAVCSPAVGRRAHQQRALLGLFLRYGHRWGN